MERAGEEKDAGEDAGEDASSQKATRGRAWTARWMKRWVQASGTDAEARAVRRLSDSVKISETRWKTERRRRQSGGAAVAVLD